jgi:hypothetical protein
MMRIRDFDGLEVHPSKVVGGAGNQEIRMPCEPELASSWTVYGHYRSGDIFEGIDGLEDYPTEAEALKFRDRLLDCYPHLSGERAFAKQPLKNDPAP